MVFSKEARIFNPSNRAYLLVLLFEANQLIDVCLTIFAVEAKERKVTLISCFIKPILVFVLALNLLLPIPVLADVVVI